MNVRIENSKLIKELTVPDLRLVAAAIDAAMPFAAEGLNDRAAHLRDLFDDTANALAALESGGEASGEIYDEQGRRRRRR